nr:MAG TPA: hypothetical protein [Bacteriophage sp.]
MKVAVSSFYLLSPVWVYFPFEYCITPISPR